MRVIVHIGHYKTGTTSLQRRFTDHRESLAEQGVVYPDLGALHNPNGSVLPSHSALVFEILRRRELQVPRWYQDLVDAAPTPPTLESMTDALRGAMADAGDRDVLLSSEELMRFGAGGRHEGLVDELAELLGDHPVRIFCHLRRPDLHLPSWYNQLVKLGARRANMSESVDVYFDKIHVDYAMALRPWVERFGRENVIVHRYERRRGDVTDDLLRAFGREVTLPPGSELWENPRFPDTFVETLRIWNDLRPTEAVDDRFRRILQQLSREPELSGLQVEFLTPAARRKLHDRCVEMADELDELLGRSTPLFDDLDEMLTAPAGTIRDIDANARFAPLALERLAGLAVVADPPAGDSVRDVRPDTPSPAALSPEALRRARDAATAARAAVLRRGRGLLRR